MSSKGAYRKLFCSSLLLLLILPASLASNDRCIDPEPLTVPSTTLGSTVGAAHDPEPPKEACNGGLYLWGVSDAPGVWYSVIGTGNRMTATTCHPGTTTLDTTLRVYCADCDHLVCVAGNDDGSRMGILPVDPACEVPPGGGWNTSSTVTWCSRAGQEYRIFVNGWAVGGWPPSTGDFELSVEDSGEPCWGGAECTSVDVVGTFLEDNVDDDGWADTNETVAMRLRVYNRSGSDLTGLEARLSTDDPKIACVADPVMPIGDLPAGQTITTPGAFLFRVADVNRGRLMADFAADLKVALSSDQFVDAAPPRCSVGGGPCDVDEDCPDNDLCDSMTCDDSGSPCRYSFECGTGGCSGTCSRTGRFCWDYRETWGSDHSIYGCDGPDVCVDESRALRLDLDLDAAGGTGNTTFFESFENTGLGSFTEMNLDAGLGEPIASDGYRCQYSDPDNPDSNDPGRNYCWPGIEPERAGAYFWQADDGRSFTGSHSLYMGTDLGGGEYATPCGVMEAAGTEQPINLGWERSCTVGGAACTQDADCPSGGACLAAAPELTFKHQLDLVDWRSLDLGPGSPPSWNLPGHTVDRGVVQAQVVDDAGQPMGPWVRLEPYKTPYNARAETIFWNCMFDPVDDGNTEGDLFESAYPLLRGPSSTCFPQLVFSSAGDTDRPFAPGNTAGMDDGPGLQGETGLGTWVESKVDLSPFRGQRIQLRFLVTTIEMITSPDWTNNPWWDGPFQDDGWWIDDVTVTDVLVAPATLAVDNKDNSGIGVDGDADCVADSADCAPGITEAWDIPGEAQQLRMSHVGGAEGTTTLSWDRPQALGGTAAEYILVARGPGFCDETSAGEGLATEDTGIPSPGALHTFLVRAENACGTGPLGTDSVHDPREGCLQGGSQIVAIHVSVRPDGTSGL